MATAKLPTIPHAQVPQYGVIVGGPLDGWQYGITRFEVRGRDVFLVVNATPPAWCFPDTVLLNAHEDFEQLQAGPGATFHDSKQAIHRAIEAQQFGWDN